MTFPDDVSLHEPAGGESLPQRELQSLAGGRCRDCDQSYSAREAVFSIFLGLKDVPRCLPCVSRRLERRPAELQADLISHIRSRDCYLQAWYDAERIDGIANADAGSETPASTIEADYAADCAGQPAAAEWNAGDMGCGELVMALRLRLGSLLPGDTIRVTATDPAAPEDLPAWCRLCGHRLIAMNHPQYWIRRKGD